VAKKFKSLMQIYSEKSYYKKIPSIPRQSVYGVEEAVDVPPQPDSAYVELYTREPNEQQQKFIGSIDVDYFNKILKPAIDRGSSTNINVNKLVEKRLTDANITTENLNAIFDFIKKYNLNITPENFKNCEASFKNAIVSETSFNVIDFIARNFSSDGSNEAVSQLYNNLQSNIEEVRNIIKLRALSASATFGNRSGVAGPGEVLIAFFGNGKKLHNVAKKGGPAPEDKGDISIDGLRIEMKGDDARIKPTTKGDLEYSQGTAIAFLKKNLKSDPAMVVKYIAGGDALIKDNSYDKEIEAALGDKVDEVTIRNTAAALAMKHYQKLGGFNSFCLINHTGNLNCLGFTCNKSLTDIIQFMISHNLPLRFDRGGHRLPENLTI